MGPVCTHQAAARCSACGFQQFLVLCLSTVFHIFYKEKDSIGFDGFSLIVIFLKDVELANLIEKLIYN